MIFFVYYRARNQLFRVANIFMCALSGVSRVKTNKYALRKMMNNTAEHFITIVIEKERHNLFLNKQ